MRFSDLNYRDKDRDAPSQPGPVKNRTLEKDAAKPSPLDAPIPDFPAIRDTASPINASAADSAPAFAGKPSPKPDPFPAPQSVSPAQPLSRKDTQRKDAAAAREAERPFAALDIQAKEIYIRTLSAAKELLTLIDRPYLDKCGHFIALSDLLARELPENPVILRYTAHATADNYLYAHSANVAIISQAVGLAMGLEKSELSILGFCALAHDIGMTAHSGLANAERRLADEEFNILTRHSEEGADKIDRMLGLDQRLKERARSVLLHVHERIDASGYPKGLRNEEIGRLSQIIGIADVYEAMTHPRSWRPAAHPHDVIKHLIDKEDKGFDSKVVKAVIRSLSIYPPGSLVSLSGGDIAEVVKVNRSSMTRPVVSVLLNPDFTQAQPRLVDLMEHPLSAIENIINEETLAAHNPKFAARRELARWWVEWQ